MGTITHIVRRTALAAAAAASIAAAQAASAPGTVWLMDAQSKCYVLYADSQPADSVTWTGSCTNGGATGDGTATFMNGGRFAGQISGKFVNGAATGPVHANWADGAHYDGNEEASRFSGQGVLTTGSGDRFDGTWGEGRMNGRGSVVWANGDRYDGEWRDNKAEGHGVQTWADGRKYDGAWKNDLPNGHGLLTRKDGSIFEGEFADGEPKPATVVASPSTPTASPAAPKPAAAVAGLSSASNAPADKTASVAATTPPASASANAPRWVDAFVGQKLLAVDGSMLSLQPADGGLSRQVTAPNGSIEAVNFTFLNGRQGTVTDPHDVSKVAGVFRLSDTSLDVDYADGRSETWSAAAGGVAMVRRGHDGVSCAAWYPEGHAFSAGEKQAALAAYATQLGLQTPSGRTAAKACAQPASVAVTATPAAAAAPSNRPPPEPARSRHRSHKRNTETAAIDQPVAAIVPVMMALVDAAIPIDVRASTVHPIDAPSGPPTGNSGADASGCLKVDTEGANWGFRNACGFPVQFAWCVMGGSDERDACDGGAVPGAVSANGFDALFADSNLKAEHDLRWIACEGGSGDVVPRLVKTDPPAGRCVRGHA